MKLRLVFSKLGPIKFISHLDTIRLFQRAFSRAQIPLAYSKGYNPHPKMSIAIPLSLGMESEAEVLDLDLVEDYDPDLLRARVNACLPKGLEVKSVKTDFDPTSVFSQVEEMDYSLVFPGDFDISREAILEGLEGIKEAQEVLVARKRKRGKKKVEVMEDIKPLIVSVDLDRGEEDDLVLTCRLKAGEGGNLRPDRLLMALRDYSPQDFDLDLVQIKRLAAYDQRGEALYG